MADREPSELESLINAYRARVIAMELQATGVLSTAYAEIMPQLQTRLAALERKITERQETGEPVSPAWLFQQERYRELIQQTRVLMDRYGQTTLAVTTAAQQAAVRDGLIEAGRELAAVSGGSGEIVSLVAGWAAIPDASVQQMVGALQASTPLGQLIESFGRDAVQDVNSALLSGMALGLSARDITRNVQRAAGISRTRAETIVRTETLRAVRGATIAAYKESGIVKGWRWSASLSARTCSACLSKHGSVHPLSEPFASHPACRCSASPWLGDGNDTDWESGEDWLKRQPLPVQQQVLGKEGGALFNAGQLRLEDFQRRTVSPQWGASVTQGSLQLAKYNAAKAGRPVSPKAIQAAQAQTAPSAVTSAISESLKLPTTGKRATVDAIAETMNVIDRVHRVDPGMPEIPVSVSSGSRALGAYEHSRSGRPVGIKVSSKGREPMNTFAHEVGHFIDHKGLDHSSPYQFASKQPAVRENGILAPWFSAIQNSQPYKRLLEMQKSGTVTFATPQGTMQTASVSRPYVNYLLDPVELWARSYSQYITVRSQHPTMLAELQSDLDQIAANPDASYPVQWTNDEFVPIAEAIDEMFRKKGWID